jgi:hypothetical protein
MSLHQFAPLALVLALTVSIFFALSPVSQQLAAIVPLLYVSANLLASLYVAFKRGWKFFPLLMVSFAIIHIAYGSGFLIGLAKFWNRWGDRIGNIPEWSRENIG